MAIWLWRLACPGEEDWTLPAVDGKGSYVETKWLAIEQGDVTSLHIFGTYFSCFEPTVGHLLKTRTAVQSHGQPWHQWCDRCLTWISVRYYEHHFFLRNRMLMVRKFVSSCPPHPCLGPGAIKLSLSGTAMLACAKADPPSNTLFPDINPTRIGMLTLEAYLPLVLRLYELSPEGILHAKKNELYVYPQGSRIYMYACKPSNKLISYKVKEQRTLN